MRSVALIIGLFALGCGGDDSGDAGELLPSVGGGHSKDFSGEAGAWPRGLPTRRERLKARARLSEPNRNRSTRLSIPIKTRFSM